MKVFLYTIIGLIIGFTIGYLLFGTVFDQYVNIKHLLNNGMFNSMRNKIFGTSAVVGVIGFIFAKYFSKK